MIIRMTNNFDALLDHQGHIYQADSREAVALCGHEWGATYQDDEPDPTRGISIPDDPRGTLTRIRIDARRLGIPICPSCVQGVADL